MYLCKLFASCDSVIYMMNIYCTSQCQLCKQTTLIIHEPDIEPFYFASNHSYHAQRGKISEGITHVTLLSSMLAIEIASFTLTFALNLGTNYKASFYKYSTYKIIFTKLSTQIFIQWKGFDALSYEFRIFV